METHTDSPKESQNEHLVTPMREKEGAIYDPGTVLIDLNWHKHTYSSQLFRIESYYVSSRTDPPTWSQKQKKTYYWLRITYKQVERGTQPGNMNWDDRVCDEYYNEFSRSKHCVPYDFDYESMQAKAVSLLNGTADNEMSEELLALQSGEEQAEQSTEIVGRSSKVYLEQQVGLIREKRNRVLIIKSMMELEIAKRLSALEKIKGQAMLLVDAMNKKVQRIMRVITTIELYLGVDEELFQLQEGTSADANEPISFRQLCLFMDEEISVKSGYEVANKFDLDTIDQFDEWVLQPQNLDHILPEKRAIVVLRPRRNDKIYSSSENWRFEAVNKVNKESTYFLIRDGENIYRIFTNKLKVLNRLFPKRTELATMFEKFEAATSERSKEEFEDDIYQYRKRATFLQGLLDRTTVFGTHEPINLFNLNKKTEQMIRFIYDDDDNLLSDGRPAFADWKKALNEHIAEGCRVLITGDYHRYGYSGKNWTDRIFYYVNDHRAPSPPDRGIYIVETKERTRYNRESYQALVVKHNPGDTIYGSGWGNWDPHERTKRISFEIFKHDDFVFPFDFVNPDDIHYYRFSRTHRRHYANMLPILETIEALKRQEEQDEAPFIQLVLDEATRKKIDTNVEAVKQAVIWWKTKNKWKRAIAVDDAKALRMILQKLKSTT